METEVSTALFNIPYLINSTLTRVWDPHFLHHCAFFVLCKCLPLLFLFFNFCFVSPFVGILFPSFSIPPLVRKLGPTLLYVTCFSPCRSFLLDFLRGLLTAYILPLSLWSVLPTQLSQVGFGERGNYLPPEWKFCPTRFCWRISQESEKGFRRKTTGQDVGVHVDQRRKTGARTCLRDILTRNRRSTPGSPWSDRTRAGLRLLRETKGTNSQLEKQADSGVFTYGATTANRLWRRGPGEPDHRFEPEKPRLTSRPVTQRNPLPALLNLHLRLRVEQGGTGTDSWPVRRALTQGRSLGVRVLVLLKHQEILSRLPSLRAIVWVLSSFETIKCPLQPG